MSETHGSPLEGERYWTVRQIAERLQLSQHTILRALREGQLAGVRFGKAAGWRVSESDLQRWIAQHQRPPKRRTRKTQEE
jgi:excisionase family DNA binding protein